MRSFLSLFALVPSVFSAAVGAVGAAPDESTTTTPEVLAYDPQNAKILFSVPNPPALGDDESLTLELQAYSSDSPCGVRDVFLNGSPLREFWSEGLTAHGSHDVLALPGRDSQDHHAYNISWTSTCLFPPAFDSLPYDARVFHGHSAAELLSVTITGTETVAFEQPLSFMISLRQMNEPELLRLEMCPHKFDGEKPLEGLDTEEWRFPPSWSRLSSMDLPRYPSPSSSASDVSDTSPLIPNIEDEIEELKNLEQQAIHLAQQIHDKKVSIKELLDAEIPSLKDDVKACGSLMCAIKAIFYRLKFALFHLRPTSSSAGNHTIHGYLNLSHQQPLSASGSLPKTSSFHGNQSKEYYHMHAYDLVDPPSPLLTVLKAIAAALGLAAILKFCRFLRCCCSPRRRADCAARREERATRRAYRRAERAYRCAERKRKWRQWWSDLKWSGRHKQHSTDYEEKRALIVEQEGRLEAAMQDEINQLGEEAAMQNELRQLRTAHDVVNDLVRAEEGRLYTTRNRRASGVSRLSRTSSLPSYSTEPPSYTYSSDVETHSIDTDSSDEETDLAPDGFTRYTPSASSRTWTPPTSTASPAPMSPLGAPPSIIGSSVIDVSPRESGETIRTAATGRAGEE